MTNPQGYYPPQDYPPVHQPPQRPSLAGRPTWQGFLTAFLFPFSAVSSVGRAYIVHWWSTGSGKYTIVASTVAGIASYGIPGGKGMFLSLSATVALCSLAWSRRVPAQAVAPQPPAYPQPYPPQPYPPQSYAPQPPVHPQPPMYPQPYAAQSYPQPYPPMHPQPYAPQQLPPQHYAPVHQPQPYAPPQLPPVYDHNPVTAPTDVTQPVAPPPTPPKEEW